jgi:hypothetical protein
VTVFVGPPPVGSTPILIAQPVGVSIANPPSVGFIVTPLAQTTITRAQVLSVPASVQTVVAVSSSNPAVATATAGTVAVGEQSADISILAGEAGTATLIIRAGNDVRSLTVFVGTPPPGSTPLLLAQPVGVSVAALPFVGRAFALPGVTRTIGVRLLDSPAAVDIPLVVTSNSPGVATVASPVTLIAGNRIADLEITTGAAGTARLTIEGAGIRFEFNVEVGTSPAAANTPLIVAPPVGVTVIADPGLGRIIVSPPAAVAPTLAIRLLAAPSAGDVHVVVRSSNTAIATVGGGESVTLTIPAGQQVLDPSLATSGAEGAAILTFEFQGERRQMSVVVGDPPANQIPAVTAPIVGLQVQP